MVCRRQWTDKSWWKKNRSNRNAEGEQDMESGKRLGGNKMWTGIHVIQIMDPGFLGALPKGTKLGEQGRQIPEELGALVKAMYNKE